MSIEPVDIYVKDAQPIPAAIAGVTVKVFSQNGSTVQGQNTTDTSGLAAFLLPDGTYSVRLYKQGVAFLNPFIIEVLSAPVAPQTNTFDLTGYPLTPPLVSDPRLCVAYGYFRTPSGAPAEGIDIHIINKFNPLSMDGAAVLSERVTVRTDMTGYVEVPLIRNAQYDVTVQGLNQLVRTISVPDAPNVNMPDLLFPVVSVVSFSPAGPYTVQVGQELVLTPTVTASDGQDLGLGIEDVVYRSSDTEVLGVFVSASTVTLRGIAAGSAQLTVTRQDNSIVRIPDTGVSGQPIAVTVTP